MLTVAYIDTPIGRLRLRASEQGLEGVDHTNQQKYSNVDWNENAGHPILKQAINELDEYFLKNRTTFSVPLSPQGTDFQKQVWKALLTIPYGETASYSDIAHQINNPKAVRAVGLANGKNPLSIFIPCHRIIGKNGTLTGYAGGLKAKTILLDHESQELRLL